MANLLLSFGKIDLSKSLIQGAFEEIDAGEKVQCLICGKKETYRIHREGTDFIASLGYLCHEEFDSMEESLLHILKTFDEKKLNELKKKLIGQYVVVLKKTNGICIFSDFFGARNVFYSIENAVISTSFEKMEDVLKTNPDDIDDEKVYEFLAVKHVLYPALISSSTFHKRIKWLMPYEYITGDCAHSTVKINEFSYTLNNSKQFNSPALADTLLTSLRTIINRSEFKDSTVASSITGGRDSRLVAVIAAEQYRNVRFRTAISQQTKTTLLDFNVGKKISKLAGVQLDTYRFDKEKDYERFCELTEGFTPHFNHSITPLITNAYKYSIGFGGVFGTELFMEIPYQTIEEYILKGIGRAKKYITQSDEFWKKFESTMRDTFKKIKAHYDLKDKDDRDYIRIFCMLDTARYSSFIMSAFNESGFELEPFGNYLILDLALKIAPEFWGNHKTLKGNATIQKLAMEKLNKKIGKVITFRHYRPMLPLKPSTFSLYLIGAFQQMLWKIRGKFDTTEAQITQKEFLNGKYISNGWEKVLLDRFSKKYGMKIK